MADSERFNARIATTKQVIPLLRAAGYKKIQRKLDPDGKHVLCRPLLVDDYNFSVTWMLKCVGSDDPVLIVAQVDVGEYNKLTEAEEP